MRHGIVLKFASQRWRFVRALSAAARLCAGVIVFAALNGTATDAQAHGATPPNVVLLIADDLTAEALSCYGSICRTPNIDALAARGVRFDRAYCQFPVCGPSRAALLSGMYPERVGVTGNGAASGIEAKLGDRASLPQSFREHVYHTTRVSKVFHMRVPGDITSGVDGPDHTAAWVERFNCRAPEWMSEGRAEHLTRESLRFEPERHYNLGFGTAFYTVQVPGDGASQADAQAAARAVEVITRHEDERPGVPLFLAVGFVRPHVPLVAPQSCFDAYPAGDLSSPSYGEEDLVDVPAAGVTMTSTSNGLAGHDDRKQRVLQAYYAAVSFMDAQVGRVLAAIDERGLSESTVVVFTSDHGYHLGEHGLWQKLSLHEESMRIPLIVAGPGVVVGSSSAIVEQIDLYPTLVDLAGIHPPSHLQGRSFRGVLRDVATAGREDAYGINHRGRWLRTERYAWLDYGDGGAELYDMAVDPQQRRNLASDPDHAEVVARLRVRLRERATAAGK